MSEGKNSSRIAVAGDNCKLIVNADDLGISKAVNNGILKAHREGIVTSASIMPNGGAFDDAVSHVEVVPSLDIGVHLTLVEERPVLDAGKIPSLVDQSGRFHEHAYQFVKHYVLGRICLKDVENELDAQLKKVQGAGLTISHVDSHQHMHVLPAIFGIVVRLANKYEIPAIRIPRERLTIRMFNLRKWRRVVELMAVNTLCKGLTKRFTRYTGNFIGFYDGGHLDLVNLGKLLMGLKAQNVYELMCHPGVADNSARYQHWGYSPETELAALTAPETKKIIADRNIALTTYSALIDDGF